MMLVVDANIIFSALVARGKTIEIFEWNYINRKLDLIAPRFLSEEKEGEVLGIMKKSELSKDELDFAIEVIESQIKFVNESYFEDFIPDAEKISPPNDFPYLALAMKIKSNGFDVAIWSNDKGLKQQCKIKVISTHELLEAIQSFE